MRPALKPALARLWRDDTTLATMADPGALCSAARTGRRRPRASDQSRRQPHAGFRRPRVTRSSRHRGLTSAPGTGGCPRTSAEPPGDRQRLAPDLASLSLLHPAPGAAAEVLRRRAGRQVEVRGCGRVGSQLAALLAAAGIGLVTTIDGSPVALSDPTPGADRKEGRRARGRRRGGRGGRPGRRGPGPDRSSPARKPDLLILTADRLDRVAPDEGDDAELWQRPLLLAGVRETTGVIGPLVLPGLAGCLRCQPAPLRPGPVLATLGGSAHQPVYTDPGM